MGPTMTVTAATDKHIKADGDLQGQVYRTVTEKIYTPEQGLEPWTVRLKA